MKKFRDVRLEVCFHSDGHNLGNPSEENENLKKFQKFLGFSHPNIAKIHDIFQISTDTTILISEFFDSFDSTNCKRAIQPPLQEKEAKNIIKDILNGLSYLHEKNIINGNVKLQNIFIKNGRTKLVDYCYFHEIFENKESFSFEDYTYFAPEFFYLSKEKIQDSLDSWNVGVLFYEMVFNEKPDTENLLFSNRITVSEGFREFITRCLEKNPQKRWSVKQAGESFYLTK